MENTTIAVKPLTKEETRILINFIEQSKIINNKCTNATTNKMEKEEWKRIADSFNAVVTSAYRNPQQLRLKWENLKKNSRKRNTAIRMNNIKTGGGGPDYIPPDDNLDRVAALLGSTVDGFTVAYGGDAELVPIVTESSNTNGGCENDSEVGMESTAVAEVVGGDGIEEYVVQDISHVSKTPAQPKRDLFTPRASGFKRKHKSDENRAKRNQAIFEYYSLKTKLLEANYENVLLENKKLKLEIEKLQNKM